MAATISGAALQQPSATPTLPPKLLPPSIAKAKQSAPTAPRIDLEPLYSSLKTAIGDNWPLYKESCALFLSGQLNQDELSRRIDPFICVDASREHLHNQFICAIYSNSLRDSPEPGVASWVSASDKLTTSSKPVTGDAAEQRLKTEVMQLPPRERHRLKQMQDDHADWLAQYTIEYQRAREMNKLPDIVPTSAGGYNKTNWETEINKRYAQPLFAESNEFPESDTISARMIPICYEEGLVGGATAGCADLLTVAVEAYMKELLADIYSRVRSNGVNYVQTAAWRKKYRREEELADRKELQRNAVGLLPCEADMGREKRSLGLMDLRLALETGNTYLSQVRLVSDRIVVGEHVDDEEEGRDDDDEPSPSAMAPRVNGITNTMTNGTHDEDIVMEDVDLIWLGGNAADREALGSVLDDCLAIGLS